jgi:hypothetical protein
MVRARKASDENGWTCPACGRLFAHTNQGHTCDPLMTLDDRLSSLTPEQRAISEAVLRLLPKIGPVHVEPVKVGFFLKRGSTFASLRMRRAGMRLSIMLPRPLDHPRLSHPRVSRPSTRIHHWTLLRSPKDVDREVRAWLAESYASQR